MYNVMLSYCDVHVVIWNYKGMLIKWNAICVLMIYDVQPCSCDFYTHVQKSPTSSSPSSSLPVSATNSPTQSTTAIATSTAPTTSSPSLSPSLSPILSSFSQPSQPIQYYDATPSPSRTPDITSAHAHPHRETSSRSPAPAPAPQSSSSPSLSPSISPSPRPPQSCSDEMTCDSRWSTIQRILGPSARPMVHNMSSRENPFGATFIYAYRGILCEVST